MLHAAQLLHKSLTTFLSSPHAQHEGVVLVSSVREKNVVTDSDTSINTLAGCDNAPVNKSGLSSGLSSSAKSWWAESAFIHCLLVAFGSTLHPEIIHAIFLLALILCEYIQSLGTNRPVTVHCLADTSLKIVLTDPQSLLRSTTYYWGLTHRLTTSKITANIMNFKNLFSFIMHFKALRFTCG